MIPLICTIARSLVLIHNVLPEEEETLLDNEDHMSHHSGSSTKGHMLKKDVVTIFGVLRNPETNRAIIAVVMVMVAQQLCGMYTRFSIRRESSQHA